MLKSKNRQLSDKKQMSDLIQLFMVAENNDEIERLLISILTPDELEQIKKRWQIVKLLMEAETQRDIAEKLHISTAKVGRGSRELKFGNGIFQELYEKIYK